MCAIEEYKDLADLKMDDLQSSIEAHEQKLISRSKDKEPVQAFQAQSNRKFDGESSKQKKGRWKSNQWKGSGPRKVVTPTRIKKDSRKRVMQKANLARRSLTRRGSSVTIVRNGVAL